MRHQTHKGLLAATMIWAALSCFAGRQVEDPCAEDKLPRGVLKILETKFAAWQVEKAEDMDAYDRELWLKAHPDKCPGIAVGHFRSKERLSYAVLLIPRGQDESGYRLLTFAKETTGDFVTQLLEEVKQGSSGFPVIIAVPPGEYSDPEEETRVRLNLDGILAERLEVGAILYYWKEGRFQELIVSE
jgi:hypothetical protein